MSQPISRIVVVNITKETQFPTEQGFGIATFVGSSDVISTNERIRTYANMSDVQVDFVEADQEYKAANLFFSRNPRPTVLKIARWAKTDTSAELRGGLGLTTDIATWAAVADGSFGITIDGVSANVTALDFTAATNLDGVAAVIQSGLVTAGFAGVTCVYSQTQKRFIITSSTAGVASTIDFLTSTVTGTDISGNGGEQFISGVAASGAEAVNGLDAESITAALNAIWAKDSSWYMFACENTVRDNATAREASAWAESRINMFFNVSNDVNVLSAGSTTDIAAELKVLERLRSALIYNAKTDEYSDMSMASYGAITIPGSSTWKFKRLPNVSPSDELTTNQSNIVVGKKCNVYATYANIPMLYEGTVCQGEFIDIIRGIDQLQARIQTNVFSLLTKAPKVAQTRDGAVKVQGEIERALRQSEAAGFLAARDIFDEVTNEYLRTEPAFTVTFGAFPQGNNRQGPPFFFTANLAGAMHFITINGNVTT